MRINYHYVIYASTLILSNNLIPHPFNLLLKPAQKASFVTSTKTELMEIVPQSKYIAVSHIKTALYTANAFECSYNYLLNNNNSTKFQDCMGGATIKTFLNIACEVGLKFTGLNVPLAPQLCYAFGRGSGKLILDSYNTGKVDLPETGFIVVKDLSARLVESKIVREIGDPMGFYIGGLLEGTANVIIEYSKMHSKPTTSNEPDKTLVPVSEIEGGDLISYEEAFARELEQASSDIQLYCTAENVTYCNEFNS